MFVEFIDVVAARSDIPNETVEVLISMILVPIFWILRGVAVVGILYPLNRFIFISSSENKTRDLIFVLFWILINILILFSGISLFWKWLWVDTIGLFIAMTIPFLWSNTVPISNKKRVS